MEREQVHHQGFDRLTFIEDVHDGVVYEGCTFTACTLANVVLRGTDFIDCTFTGCNLANLQPAHCGWKGVRFTDSKLVGVDFSLSNTFALGLRFDGCNLDFARFIGMPLTGTVFQSCTLREAHFGRAVLTRAQFLDCDLDRAVFQQTTLNQADFRTATHFAIDPDANRGLLGKYDLLVE